MFQRWLSYQQPLWLVATLFLIGVAIEIQAPYYKKAGTPEGVARDRLRKAEVEGVCHEVAKKTP